MKTGFSNQFRLIILAVLAAACVWTPGAQAGRGSLRASNRSDHRPEPARVHQEDARVLERRRQDIEAERRHAFYWSGFRPGMVITVLPLGYVPLMVGATTYDYYDGVYFQPTPAGTMAVVAPPVGAIVSQLPDGAETFVVGTATYYYAGGGF